MRSLFNFPYVKVTNWLSREPKDHCAYTERIRSESDEM